MGRTFWRAGPKGSRGVGGLWMGIKPDEDSMSEGALEVTLEELEEFLDGGQLEVRARPGFKESLRGRLWSLLQQRARRWREPES
jgi:hypothetical protein